MTAKELREALADVADDVPVWLHLRSRDPWPGTEGEAIRVDWNNEPGHRWVTIEGVQG